MTPAPLTVTANAATQVYGLANPAFTASYSGLANGDTPSTLAGTLSFTTLAAAGSPVGTYAITPSGLSSSNYTISFVSGTLAITAAPLTVTADDASKVYGQANPPFTVSYSGFVNGDTASALGGALSFSTLATAASPVGAYAVMPSGLSSSNYTISFVAGSLTVTHRHELTVTANDAIKAYGQANPAFTATYNGFVNGDTPDTLTGALSFSTVATAASPVGAYAITPSGLSSSNYAISFVSGTLTVTPAPLTVTANDATKVYGQANPAFSVSYSGFVNGDTPSTLTGALSFSTAATAASPAGTYAITPSGLSSSNYSLSFVSGTLTVTAAPLTVTANDASKVYGAALPALTASYNGFVNGDTASALGGVLSDHAPGHWAQRVGIYPDHPVGTSQFERTMPSDSPAARSPSTPPPSRSPPMTRARPTARRCRPSMRHTAA